MITDNIFNSSTPLSKETDKRKTKQNSATGTFPKLKHSNSTCTSKNRFSPLAPSNYNDQMDNDTSANWSHTRLSLPPPIFIKTDLMWFNLFCESIKQLTQPDGFLFKSSVNGLKLNTYNNRFISQNYKIYEIKKSQLSQRWKIIQSSKKIPPLSYAFRHYNKGIKFQKFRCLKPH